MAIQTAIVGSGAISQEEWDGKFGSTTKKIGNMGGASAQSADDLSEGATNKYDTGVPPASQDDLPDGTTYKRYSNTEQTKLGGIEAGAEVNPTDLAALDPTQNTKLNGIEENAAADQSGDEIVAAINAGSDPITREGALSQDGLNLVKTTPVGGEFKVKNIQRDSTGKLDIEYDDVAM